MPRSCDVLGCPNGAGNSAVSYHVVPRDEPRRSEWLAAVPMRKREGRARPKLMVCSLHFSPCDYVYDPTLRVLLGCNQRPALSRTAVPTIAPLTRQELALLQQIGSVDTVLPVVINLVEGQPSSSWLQMDELIRADSWDPPSGAMPADSSECMRSSPHENFNGSVRNTVAVSPKHIELSLPVLPLDVNIVEGQPSSLWLKNEGVTKADNWCSPNGKTSAFAADSRRKETQEHPQLNVNKTSKICHRGVGHNKMVQVCIRGKSTGAQVNMIMKDIMSQGLQTDISDMTMLTSASTQT
ncbi:uncharacterized protein LOC119431374 isoform X2 [Dermacentor silvarum]|uniref:uncharacterized protein LOC119431374 isoform X2 n=1 Tax=Dermacentor silvarum TaxID=543639 RepID=UPI002101384F|nr:uncharacterized protein LOC119431374 isoform X2 [Dermacentor silvarum]